MRLCLVSSDAESPSTLILIPEKVTRIWVSHHRHHIGKIHIGNILAKQTISDKTYTITFKGTVTLH